MATKNTENRAEIAEHRWIRLQEIGLSQLLAIPIMVLIIAYATGFVIRGVDTAFYTNLILLGSFGLATSGYVCLRIGHERRVELRNQEYKKE